MSLKVSMPRSRVVLLIKSWLYRTRRYWLTTFGIDRRYILIEEHAKNWGPFVEDEQLYLFQHAQPMTICVFNSDHCDTIAEVCSNQLFLVVFFLVLNGRVFAAASALSSSLLSFSPSSPVTARGAPHRPTPFECFARSMGILGRCALPRGPLAEFAALFLCVLYHPAARCDSPQALFERCHCSQSGACSFLVSAQWYALTHTATSLTSANTPHPQHFCGQGLQRH